jgi:PTH1 family peptidyl-tRNA hydrolase
VPGLLARLRGATGREDVVAGDRWLIVGLRNPEREYGGTRHNVGADAVRILARRLGASFKSAGKLRCEVADGYDRPGGTPLSLVLPGGYMNDAGGPVQAAAAFYKVPRERLVVVHDDLDLPLAALRVKRGGGAGGHNGLKDLISRLGGPDFLRVRIGIGRPPGRQDPADYVLKRFGAKDREQVDVTLELAADAALSLVEHGLEPTQNRFHRA